MMSYYVKYIARQPTMTLPISSHSPETLLVQPLNHSDVIDVVGYDEGCHVARQPITSSVQFFLLVYGTILLGRSPLLGEQYY